MNLEASSALTATVNQLAVEQCYGNTYRQLHVAKQENKCVSEGGVL